MSGTLDFAAEPGAQGELSFGLMFAGDLPSHADLASSLEKDGGQAGGNIRLLETPANGAAASLIMTCNDIPFELQGMLEPVAADLEDADQYFAVEAGDLGQAKCLRLAAQFTANDGIAPLEIVRNASRIALRLADAAQCIAVSWAPAKSIMGTAYFEKVVSDWLAGGPFPALGLTSLTMDGDKTFHSRGLAPICGQEIVIPAMPGLENAGRARVAIRMIDYMAQNGPIHEDGPVEIDGFGKFNVTIDPNGGNIYLKR